VKRLFAAATLALVAACESPGISDDFPEIYAVSRDQTLHVSNMSGRPLHYMIHEREDEGLLFWGKCTPANQGCPVLAPGETLRIPYAELGGYDPGDTEAIIYWWESRPDGNGGYRVVGDDETIVRL
jgi:hypothetical protein